MDLTTEQVWLYGPPLVFVVVWLFVFMVLKHRSWDHEEQQTEPPYAVPERVLYVAPNHPVGLAYLRREGLNPRIHNIATRPEQLRGFRGRIVLIQGERKHFDWPEGLMDEVAMLLATGLVTVEQERA